MKCVNCNSEVADGTKFCPYCGSPMISQQQSQHGQYQQPQHGQYQQPQHGQYQQPQHGQYQQSYASGNSYSTDKPDNNMIWGILCTVFCCIPFGVYSIILASKVNGLYNSGNYEEAQKMANEAKKWAIIGAAVGLVSFILYALTAAL